MYPYEVSPSEELVDSLAFIESSIDPRTVVRAGYGAGMVSTIPVLALFLTSLPIYVVASLAFLVPLGVAHAIHSVPSLLAAFRRTEALGETPNLIGRAVLRMQIHPSTERAIRFAAETGDGPLAASLSTHIDRSIGTPRSGLLSFAAEWTDRFPALRRSAHLLASAEHAPAGERARTLDRALGAILDGTRDQMAKFTASIRGPTTGLYAFGVMLPLALIALVPAAAIADVEISIWYFVIIYNFLLPVILLVASVWLLVRRPVAFPPPTITRAHPDVPDHIRVPILYGTVVAVSGYAGTRFVGPAFLAPIAAVGLGLGCTLLAVYRPVTIVRDSVRSVEEHLVDALYLIGRRVSEGEAVESSIHHAGERVPAETGDVFTRAAGIQRRLHIGVHDAFLGNYGALRNVPSPRARGTASLLGIAAEEGHPAGRAIVSMADHLEELQEVERETQRQLAMVTDTLESTAAYFGPLVAGATVALAGAMAEDGLEEAQATALPTETLGIVVGVYIMTLCFILVPLSVGLRHGLDRTLVGYEVGRALVFAVSLYVLAVWLAGMVM